MSRENVLCVNLCIFFNLRRLTFDRSLTNQRPDMQCILPCSSMKLVHDGIPTPRPGQAHGLDVEPVSWYLGPILLLPCIAHGKPFPPLPPLRLAPGWGFCGRRMNYGLAHLQLVSSALYFLGVLSARPYRDVDDFDHQQRLPRDRREKKAYATKCVEYYYLLVNETAGEVTTLCTTIYSSCLAIGHVSSRRGRGFCC
jgi:hypothetical protein